jgi:hypothetical protein
MKDNDRKVVDINTDAMIHHRRKEERRKRREANGEAVTRWALTDPTYDCSGAMREQP